MPIPALKRRRMADRAARRPPVNQHQSLITPNTSLDSFLFARVAEEANGMQLSVISALARMNVDPWEEATRLASMPKAAAENALAAILDLIRGRSSNHSENTATAARLVQLLPQAGQGADNAAPAASSAAGSAKGAMPITRFWWIWVCFALAMSFSTAHQPNDTAMPPGMSTSVAITAPDGKAVAPVETNAVVPTIQPSR